MSILFVGEFFFEYFCYLSRYSNYFVVDCYRVMLCVCIHLHCLACVSFSSVCVFVVLMSVYVFSLQMSVFCCVREVSSKFISERLGIRIVLFLVRTVSLSLISVWCVQTTTCMDACFMHFAF